jgi:hypothetical protein
VSTGESLYVATLSNGDMCDIIEYKWETQEVQQILSYSCSVSWGSTAFHIMKSDEEFLYVIGFNNTWAQQPLSYNLTACDNTTFGANPGSC